MSRGELRRVTDLPLKVNQKMLGLLGLRVLVAIQAACLGSPARFVIGGYHIGSRCTPPENPKAKSHHAHRA